MATSTSIEAHWAHKIKKGRGYQTTLTAYQDDCRAFAVASGWQAPSRRLISSWLKRNGHVARPTAQRGVYVLHGVRLKDRPLRVPGRYSETEVERPDGSVVARLAFRDQSNRLWLPDFSSGTGDAVWVPRAELREPDSVMGSVLRKVRRAPAPEEYVDLFREYFGSVYTGRA